MKGKIDLNKQLTAITKSHSEDQKLLSKEEIQTKKKTEVISHSAAFCGGTENIRRNTLRELCSMFATG